ncbi:restriction endonuclease subunit S [Agromyces bauzanensis]
MSRLTETLAHLCPDGVEFRPLADCVNYEQPGKYLVTSTHYDNRSATPVLTAGRTFILGYTDETDGVYPASLDSPVIIFDDFTTAYKWVDFPFKAKSSAMKMLTLKPDSTASLRYIWYAMQTIDYSPQDHARQWIGTYSRFRIPVPPPEVQREIVRALDLFTSLGSELDEELKGRRRQFAHYRDAMLALQGDTEATWTALGEVGEFIRGKRFTKSDYVDSGLGCIHYGQIYTDYGTVATDTLAYVPMEMKPRLRLARRGDLVIAATSENVDDVCKAVAWLGDDDVAVHDDCYIFRHSLDPTFASYLFQSKSFQDQKLQYVSEGKVVRVSGANMAQIRVQVPSRAEQERIVAALNTFDALVNNRATGIVAERDARQKQFEYYRDTLLTFEEAVA